MRVAIISSASLAVQSARASHGQLTDETLGCLTPHLVCAVHVFCSGRLFHSATLWSSP